MNFINLVNIRIEKGKIQFEFLYKSNTFTDNLVIYLEDSTGTIYNCKIIKCKNKVFYSYNNEISYISKILIDMPLKNYGKLKIIQKKNKKIEQLIIKNNKNEVITEEGNPYIIFAKKYKIQIIENYLTVTKKVFGDKIKYELKKQIYGLKKYKRFFIFRLLKSKKRKYYLFNDRLAYGDDNAEELFKYINENHKEFAKRCYFVLEKDSLSINRLKRIGKTLSFGSFNHKLKFLNSRIILSSHSSYLGNCFNPFSIEEMDIYKDLINKKFIFLQHGVIMNDVREYLNRELTTADLLITTTKEEYKYVKSNDFMYDKDMITHSGLPRFDKLKNKNGNKIILISPTWRALKETVNFENSEYFITYKKLLNNNRLNEILKAKGYKVKFLLHPVFSKYKNLFNQLSNEYIEILASDKIKYFELFNECSLLITDYSSIHFDVAFLKKPIIYYQFDKNYFFKEHYRKGYFDYVKDGFGKVIEKEKELIIEIEHCINNNCKLETEYKNRIENSFYNLDHNNSKRVFNKVVELDSKNDINYRFNNVH